MTYKLPFYYDAENDNITLTVILGMAQVFAKYDRVKNQFTFNKQVERKWGD